MSSTLIVHEQLSDIFESGAPAEARDIGDATVVIEVMTDVLAGRGFSKPQIQQMFKDGLASVFGD